MQTQALLAISRQNESKNGEEFTLEGPRVARRGLGEVLCARDNASVRGRGRGRVDETLARVPHHVRVAVLHTPSRHPHENYYTNKPKYYARGSFV